MRRLEQTILIVTFLAFAWLAMQAVHELGHVAGAWLTGGEVIHVALHPGIISRTDLGYNPHPAMVVWGGPLVGALLPWLVLLAARAFKAPGIYLFRFFAGFCLIANGFYIALGPADGASDSGVMMLYGASRWVLVLFGMMTIPAGLYLWHGQGGYFGLGGAGGRVDRRAVVVSVLLLVAVVGAEIILGSK